MEDSTTRKLCGACRKRQGAVIPVDIHMRCLLCGKFVSASMERVIACHSNGHAIGPPLDRWFKIKKLVTEFWKGMEERWR